MLSKILKLKYSTGPGLSQLKQQLTAPIKHIKRTLEPTGQNYSRLTNTTEEAFDEVAHEWQALVAHNPFDINVFNYLENTQSSNFGTVDNPLVVFTSETPFRYVGCTGQMNEDDYEGHELMYFMLREGPMQRCMGCGQVFKLVRLRNEFSPEMDYYLSNFHPYDSIEMGESDTTVMMSPWKYSSHYEYSQFETPSNNVYSMINPDEHDRILVDPAFRLERTKKLEEKLKVYTGSLREVERKFEEKYGQGVNLIPLSKTTYETMIDVELAIKKLDRNFRKVARFQNRQFLDRENHERREKRMKEKERERWDENYAFYTGNLTEEEQKYRDYYMTELENYPEDEVQEGLLDKQEILQQEGRYKLSKYDFQEQYTRNAEDDQSSSLQKKIFSFKYRMAADSLEDFQRKNTRMIQRQIERYDKNQEYMGVLQALANRSLDKNWNGVQDGLDMKYLDIVVQESALLHNDYYESEGEDMKINIENVSSVEKQALVSNYENFLAPKINQGSFQLIPKRQWENAFGVWENMVMELQDYQQVIQPKSSQFAVQYQIQQQMPLGKQELVEAGLLVDEKNKEN
ncbi:hypothetical protein IMG5_096630 [Ichthyophthirius multifiliis]|uniref:Uncharacterized protein n=1 Tax=Ichthyophthirius multifiliis TaxID=5932 RepID=G0QRP9_ICHMU|nr:hypothetical protein IMG5_096630 [Ichthyophthirius multifiliis]EGR32106.1 hypothetical protein IMG5_096630 [Ichthyophthirius multifiliis]|eukprot:XP_004035592.1 hypothetical protein IMG5_096630 [Ichthyophthirius multifiliis]